MVNPIKRQLYGEMLDAAKSGSMNDLRARYGKSPVSEPKRGGDMAPELSEEDLEPLLSITVEVKKPKGDEEPDAGDPSEPDENEPDDMPAMD